MDAIKGYENVNDVVENETIRYPREARTER